MPALDVDSLARDMLSAVRGVLKKPWPDVRDYAAQELKKIASDIGFIEKQVAAGKMTEDEARLHLGIQKNAARTVLLAMDGIGLIAAEEAINAAAKIVAKTVNTALGFALL